MWRKIFHFFALSFVLCFVVVCRFALICLLACCCMCKSVCVRVCMCILMSVCVYISSLPPVAAATCAVPCTVPRQRRRRCLCAAAASSPSSSLWLSEASSYVVLEWLFSLICFGCCTFCFFFFWGSSAAPNACVHWCVQKKYKYHRQKRGVPRQICPNICECYLLASAPLFLNAVLSVFFLALALSPSNVIN